METEGEEVTAGGEIKFSKSHGSEYFEEYRREQYLPVLPKSYQYQLLQVIGERFPLTLV